MDSDNKMLMDDPGESSDNYQDIQEVQASSSLAHYSLPGSDDERNMEELLYMAISKKRLQKVQELLRAGVKTNIINRNYNTTPLHYAVELSQYDIVEELLLKEWKTNVDAKNANGDTPLHIATLNSDRDLVHLLVKNQANVNVENSAGMTPIELAEDPGVISVLDKYCKLAMNSSLLTKIGVPDDGSCLFWATALAYLYPIKQNNDAFQERFQKLFGNVSSVELSLVRDLIQQYHPTVNDADVLYNEVLTTLVTEKFRKRVVAVMSSRQKQFEDSITTYDFLYSKQEDYVTGGKFQKGFLREFSQEVIQYNIDIAKLKPDVFNKAAIEIIDSELSKVPDQHHVRQFIFKSYLKCMSNPTAWGGNHELQAVSEILCCSILVFYDYDKHVICHDAGNDQLQLFNNREVHYEFGLVSGQALIEAIKSSKQQKAKMFLDLGVDNVNYQDSAGFTALHYAVYCGSAEITQLLLKQGAKSDVRNCYGETPIDIAISSENDTVASFLQICHPQLISAQQKHVGSDNSWADTFDQMDKSSSDQTDGMRRSRMVSSMHQDYEVKLIMLFLLQGLSKTKDRKISNFYLATDVAEAGMFDTIFKYKYKDQYGAEKSKIIFLQVKCKPDTDKGKITYAGLLSKSKGNPFSLKQCFNSYKKIKQLFLKEVSDHPLFDSKFEHTDCDFIIYTNASFAFEETAQNAESKCVDPDSVLYQEEKPECNHYYELVVNEDNRKEILDTMQESSDSLQLAKELVKSVLCDESPTVNLCCEGIVRKYHFPLLESVIIRETQHICSFRVSFLNGDVNLSSRDKIFRDTFFAEAVKITKKTEDELKVALSSKLIKFHSDQLEGDDLDLYLPSDLVSELEVKEFFRRLKLFCDQPDGNELGEIITQKIQLVYSVPQNDVDLIYHDVKDKVQRWWKSESSYLTETNRFFQDSVKTSIFFNVKKPVTMFTGRSNELAKLHSLMQVDSRAVITGIGGIGKTELARHYIDCFRNHYENIIWINATNRITLTMSFHELAKGTLRLSITDENGMDRDIKHIVKEVYNFFSKRKSVFVFDDCENYEEICEFMPSHSVKFNQKDLYILLTSRYQEWGNEIPCLVLGEFSMEEAMGFVKQKLNISPHDASQDEDIKSLVMKLHCFPLAIVQAVAYIEYQRETGNFGFSDHARQFEQVLNFEEYESAECSHHLKPLFAVLEIITSKLNHDEQHGQTALKILDTISYFTLKINVSHEVFLSLADGNKKQLISAVDLLIMNSVLAHEQKVDLLTIHPLVQQLRRIELKTKGLEEEKLKTVLKLVMSYLDEQTASHAVAAWSYASKYENLIMEFGKLPSQIINVLLDSVRYEEAFMFGIGSFESLAKLLGPLHEDTLVTFTNIIKVLHVQGINEDTGECLEKIKLILDSCRWESLVPEDGSKMIPVGQKNYDKVLTTYQKIIDGIINESVLMRPPVHQKTLSSTTVATGILSSTGILDAKLKTIKEEVDKEKQTWGPGHPQNFLSEIKLAEILFQKGNYCDALRTYKELLKKSVKILGPDHLHILKIENGMCEVYFAQGNYVVAQEMCTKILEKYGQTTGSQHPDTLRTGVLLAKILDSQGEFNESLNMYHGCLKKIMQLLGPLHCDVLRTENLIAEVLCKQGNNSKAMEVYQEVLNRFVPVLGPDDLDILQTKSGIASIYFKQGNYERALRTYCEIFNKQIALLGIEHLHTLFTLSNIHHVLFNSGKLLKLAYIHSEYNDMHDIRTFDECSRLLLYWISFSSEELDLATHFGAGATTNLPDNFDWSHLNLATMIAKEYILNYLTKKASSFKTADKSSSSFIHTLYKAVEKDELGIVKTLVECTDFIASDRYDLTPVHIAVQEGHLDIIKYFVLKGIKLNVPNENGLTLLQRATYSGKLDIARFLIEKGADVNVLNKDGLTLLHWASVNGNLRTVKCLVEKGADINVLNKDGLTPLCLAVSSGCAEIVKYLVGKGADVNVHDKNGLTLLHTAVSVGDVNTFVPLINDPDYLNAFDIDDLTLLHRASSQGKLNIVKYLVENGADVNIQNKNRLTPLHLAAQKGKLSVIQYLISQKANCSIQDEHGFTPLHFAANAGKSEVVKHLVHEGADINAETKDGETVLHTAVRSGCLDAVRCLTEKGAYLMKPDVNRNTPLEEAVNKGDNDDIAKFLIKAYAKSLNSLSVQRSSKGTEHENSSDISFLTPIYFAVVKGYLDIVEYLVNEDTNDIYYTDKDDQSLLHLAAGKGYLDIINFLLRKGADINRRNAYEETPLYDAINNNYYNIVRCFAEKGAELNCVNKRGESPLHRAVFAGYLEIVMFLVDSDVCIDTQDKYGNTPLLYAAKQGNLSLVKYLLAEGAHIDTVNNYGKSTLHLCIETEEENFSVVKFLVEVCPSQKFAIDDNGWTVLHSAAYWDHPGLIEFLLEKGVNVNVRNYNYEAALHLASSGSSIYAVKALLKRKANIDARDNDNKTFLDVASPSTRKEIESLKDYLDFIEKPWYRNEELLRLLNEPIAINEIQSHLEKEKIDINAGTLENETFLHFVSRKGSKELVKMALEQGADIYATTDIAETALHLAARVGNTEVLQLLLSNSINVSFKNDHGETALHEAARIGNEESVELLFDQDPYVINDTTAFGNTALHNAVVSRHLKIVEFLLSKGFEIDHKNVYGDTPLFVAVRAGNEAMVTLLLKYSADIKTRNCRGNTCVHIASMRGKWNILQLLLDAGAEVNSRNLFRETPLHLACNKQVVQLLVDSGADVNARTSKLPIHKFAEKGDEHSIRVMLSCSRDCIFEQDVDGSQPIHVLAREGHVDSIKLLYGAGASLDAKDLSGVRPIHLAAREGHLNVVQYILEQTGISDMIEVRDDSGYQPIHVAAREGHRHIVEFLLKKKGHLVNSRSAYDVVPLHLAARNLHMDVITCLIKETGCFIDAKDKLMHSFLHHFFAGLYNKCKKYVAVMVEHVTLFLKVLLESKNRSSMLSSETQSDLVITSNIRSESMDKLWHVFELRDITDSETVEKIEQIPWFCNVLRYYNNVTTLAGEVLNLVKIISEPKNFNDVCHAYNEMKNDIEDISKRIQENVTQIKDDGSNQDLEVIFHFLRFLFLTLDITLLKFSCCLQQFQVTQQICKRETLLANYAKILNNYCDFVNSFLNKRIKNTLDTGDKPSFDLGIMKEALRKLDNLEHFDTSDEASREQFYWKKIKYYVETSKLEIPGMEDEKMKTIQRLATQRSLQIIGDGEAIKSLKSKLHADSAAALTNVRNNYLSHLTNQNKLFARVMAECRPEVFNVVCDLDLISKIYTTELNEGTKLNAIQNLSEHLDALSGMDCELQKVVGRLRNLNARCRQHEQFLLLEENTKEIYQLHEKRTSLKSSLKEKFAEMDHTSKMIDEYFLKVSELKVDSPKLKLFLAVPFFERQLALLENTVLKDSCIEKFLRENLSFTVNQKPVERIMLCLKSCKQLQIAMEFLIFDLRSVITDPLKECDKDFHQEMKEKLKGFFSYPWLRNHLAHLSHGNALCHELTDLSKVCASNAFMLMKKGKLLTAFIGLCLKMHQNKKEFTEQDTACLFGKIGWSDCRVEFLLALKEVGDVKKLQKEADEFIKHLSDVDFQKMLLEWRQIIEFLKLLQECLGSCNIGRLKSKTELFFRGLNEEEFTDQLLRLFQDNEYLKIVQDIMGHTSLTEEVAKYLNIKKLDLGKFVKMDNYREFFKWLHDLVKGTPKALKALQIKVKVTANALKSQKHCSDSSAREYFRVFSKELDECQLCRKTA